MATDQKPSPNQKQSPHENPANNAANERPSLVPEIGPDGLARESPVIAYTEKIIEEEQLQLKKYIEENYSKIRDVERELANLSMEMKLTAGPKKAALEHMRKKIEMSTERLRAAKLKEEQARKAWEVASKAVKEEEAIKQKLCEDLNNLVTESSNAQFHRLEELKRRMEALSAGRSSISVPSIGAAPSPSVALEANGSTGSPPSPAKVGEVPEKNTRNSPSPANVGDAPEKNIQPSLDAEGRAKRKGITHARGRGLGAVPKGRGAAAPGWTGAGFDIDSRS